MDSSGRCGVYVLHLAGAEGGERSYGMLLLNNIAAHRAHSHGYLNTSGQRMCSEHAVQLCTRLYDRCSGADGLSSVD